MSKKPTISSITSGYTSTTALNANFEALRDGFDNTLSLDGSTPNAMNADFDMNSNDILNANEVNASALRLGGVLVSASNLNAAGATLYSDNYTGDGSTVSYTMSYQPFIKDNTQVYIDGVYQNKAGYETSGTTLTFSEAPPLNSNIEIVVARSLDVAGTSSANVDYIQGDSGSVTRTVEAKLQEFVSVKDFGAVGDGVTDDTAAIQAAIDSGAKEVYFPSGTYLVSTNITIKTGQKVYGAGENSLLRLDDVWFGADGVTAGTSLSHFIIQDIAIERINTSSASGPAFVLRGDTDVSGAKDVYRFTIRNVHVKSNKDALNAETGYGYDIQAAYLGTIENMIVQDCGTGLYINQRTGRGTGANAISFMGGEIQSCANLAYLRDAANIGFYATTFEGSTSTGVHLDGECNGVGFYNTYTEGCAGYDFRLSDTTGLASNIACVFEGIVVREGTKPKDYSLILDACLGLSINGYYAKGPGQYAIAIINNNGTGSSVQGTFVNVVEPFLNPFRNLPISTSSQAVGTPLVDKETYGFFNLFRNTYEQDFTSTSNSGGVATQLRSITLGQDTLSRFGVPVFFKCGGSVSSSINTKTISVNYDGGLVKNFTTTTASQDWELSVEILPDPATSNSYRLSMKFIIDGSAYAYHESVLSDSGTFTLTINGQCVDDTAITCKNSYYRVER